MPGYIVANSGNLFDPVTGRWVGIIDHLGREQLIDITGGLSDMVASGGYEVGDFMPVIAGTGTAGTGTYTYQEGYYTRVGDRLYFNLTLEWSAHDGVGDMVIDGLPVPANADSNNYIGVAIGYYNGTDASHSYQAVIAPGSTQIALLGHTASVGLAPLVIVSAARIVVGGYYLL